MNSKIPFNSYKLQGKRLKLNDKYKHCFITFLYLLNLKFFFKWIIIKETYLKSLKMLN